ncbi:MAG: hypothetical protein KDC35_01370 [Acidobacteria bacterium]|nr:hypothetical protein [Acidobacteriota bacterium]
MKTLGIVLACAALGFLIGYGIFGELAGRYVSISTILTGPDGIIEKGIHGIAGIDTMRTRILMCTVGGALLGLVVTLWKGKKR